MTKIVIIGENCTDKFIYGSVNRLCPEAPVPILNPYKTTKNPGMAGNVVENVKALKKDCDITFIHQESKIVKTRFVDEQSNQMIIRVDEGEDNIKPLVMTEELIDVISKADIVIVSDYNKGFLQYEFCEWLTNKFINIPIFVDSKKKDLSCFNNSYIKLNKKEYEELIKINDNICHNITNCYISIQKNNFLDYLLFLHANSHPFQSKYGCGYLLL